MRLKCIAFYLGACLIGATIGLTSWYLQFQEYKAIKVIGLDRIDIPGIHDDYAIDPIILIETIKSPGFAEKIAKRTGLPELTEILPAAVYGGRQALTIRNLSGNPPAAIELRLRMPTAEMATTVMAAVSDEIEGIQSERAKTFLDVLSRHEAAKAIQLAGETPLSVQNERRRLDQFALNSALIEAVIKNRTGQIVETAVLPPGGPTFLMLLGGSGMLCLAILVTFSGWAHARFFQGLLKGDLSDVDRPVENTSELPSVLTASTRPTTARVEA
jgi:hypothetical protein